MGGEKGGKLIWSWWQPFSPKFVVSLARKREEAGYSRHFLQAAGRSRESVYTTARVRGVNCLSQSKGLDKDIAQGFCHN